MFFISTSWRPLLRLAPVRVALSLLRLWTYLRHLIPHLGIKSHLLTKDFPGLHLQVESFHFQLTPCVPPWKPRRSHWLKLYGFSLLMHTFPKLVTLIISLVTQAKMLTVSLVPTHCFTRFHRISGCIHSVSTYFSNLSSPLYPTFKNCQVHQCPSPYQQQAFQTSILGNPSLMLHPYPFLPVQRSAATVVDSSCILSGLPTSSSWVPLCLRTFSGQRSTFSFGVEQATVPGN